MTILKIILSVIFDFFMGKLKGDPMEKLGNLEVENEIATKSAAVLQKQVDIAARPADTVDDSLKWLRADASPANDK